MATTIKISQLNELETASLNTVFAGVDNGTTYKISLGTIKNSLSVATTGSNTFTGIQIITGSNGYLAYGGDIESPGNNYYTLADIHTYNDSPWLERFYNDSFSTSSAVMAYFGWNDGRFVFHNESTQSIGLQVNGYSAENGLLVYQDKVKFINNIEVSGIISGSFSGSVFGYVSNSQTSSFITNSQTSSFITNSQTSSFISPMASINNSLYSVTPAAGIPGVNAYYSNFIGPSAGFSAGDAHDSNFIGNGAGRAATNASFSNFIGVNAGYGASNANASNFIGYYTGLYASGANGSNFMGYYAGLYADGAYNSNFMGYYAGYQATNARYSNFIGFNPGYQASGSNYSNIFGYNAGYQAYNAPFSNFIGSNSGRLATNASYSNFIGEYAGNLSANAGSSNFIGRNAGSQAINASDSNFIGTSAGYAATNAIVSNFIGLSVGYQATNATYSTLIGYKVGQNPNNGFGIGNNNIIIGTNITLSDYAKDSINLGGIIFGTGSYSETNGNPFSGSVNGKVGINVVNPQYTLDVSGSGNYSNGLTVTGSMNGNVTALSILSNTASLDLSTASFYTLELVGGSNTYINPTNIKPGLSVSLLVSTTGSATVSFPSTVKQPSGSAYVPTTTTAKDVLTFVSFDSTTLYLANVKNLI